MSLRYYTSDLHIGHEFVATLRGFENADAMDAAMVANWNSVVRERDHVWVLGDVTAGSFNDRHIEVLDKLNGTKHLVSGNHDRCHPMHRNAHTQAKKYMRCFDTVQSAAEHRIDGRKVLLSHFPYSGDHSDGDRFEQWRLRDEGQPLLCGHVHSAWQVSRDGRAWNVGQDWQQKPVSEHEVVAWLDSNAWDAR